MGIISFDTLFLHHAQYLYANEYFNVCTHHVDHDVKTFILIPSLIQMLDL